MSLSARLAVLDPSWAAVREPSLAARFIGPHTTIVHHQLFHINLTSISSQRAAGRSAISTEQSTVALFRHADTVYDAIPALAYKRRDA